MNPATKIGCSSLGDFLRSDQELALMAITTCLTLIAILTCRTAVEEKVALSSPIPPTKTRYLLQMNHLLWWLQYVRHSIPNRHLMQATQFM